MNIPLVQNLQQLAPLSRPEQLEHIEHHVEQIDTNFQGIQIHLAHHDHTAILGHIHEVARHYEDALAVQVGPNTAFDYAIFHALRHLNQAAGIINNHQAQQQQQQVAVPAVVLNNNAVNNQVDDGNESDSSHGSDASSQPSSISSISEPSEGDEQQHAVLAFHNHGVHHQVEDDGDNSPDFSVSDYTTTEESSHAPALAPINQALIDAFAFDPNDPELL